MVNATDSKNNKMRKEKIHYTEGMLFQVRLTSRYLSLMGTQIFEKLNMPISFEEYLILDIISYNEGICHRDLAKMLLRDRSNLGKIASKLEKLKLIKVKPDFKNNRAVKKIYITEKGKKLCDEIYEKVEPHINFVMSKITNEEQLVVSESLTKFRQILDELVETKI